MQFILVLLQSTAVAGTLSQYMSLDTGKAIALLGMNGYVLYRYGRWIGGRRERKRTIVIKTPVVKA